MKPLKRKNFPQDGYLLKEFVKKELDWTESWAKDQINELKKITNENLEFEVQSPTSKMNEEQLKTQIILSDVQIIKG